MRKVKAKGILAIIAGLVLLFHAGSTIAVADDRGQKNDSDSKGRDNAQVTTVKTNNSTQASVAAKAAADAKASATTGVVAGVQTTKSTTGGGSQAVGGVQTLSSTSTGTNFPMAALGGLLVSLGVFLLRRPQRGSNN